MNICFKQNGGTNKKTENKQSVRKLIKKNRILAFRKIKPCKDT